MADPSIDAVFHDFFDRAAREGEDRRAARHRLDHDEPERLLPLDREEHRPGSREQRILLLGVRFAHVLDEPSVDEGSHLPVPILAKGGLDLSRKLQSNAGAPCHFDGDMRPLARRHSADEHHVVVFCR